MTTPFTIPFILAPHSTAGFCPDSLEPLGYEIVAHEKSQRQFRNRKLIRPRIDLDDYRFEALIDWIDVEFHTARSTNFQTVQRRLGEVLGQVPWVEGLSGRPHHNDDRFTARIQDPTREKLLAIGPALGRSDFGLAGPIGVIAIEVAVDVRPKSGNVRDRLAMVVLLQRHLLVHRTEWTDRDDDARYIYELPSGDSSRPSRLIQGIQGKPGSGRESDQLIELPLVRERILRVKSHRAPFIDSTLYFGREGGPAMVSIEHKTTNRRDPENGTFDVLPDEERRARIEVRLQGAALEDLGLRQLDDVFGFRFHDLRSRFFSFALPTVRTFGKGMERLDAIAAEKQLHVFQNSGVYGLDRFYRARLEEFRQEALRENKAVRRGDREFDVQVLPKPRAHVRFRLESFGKLNDTFTFALRTLSRRMEGSRRADDMDGLPPVILRMAA